MSEMADQENTSPEIVASRVLRALRISGRRLAHLGGGAWGVLGAVDRRRRPILRVDGAMVMQLMAEGQIVSAGEEMWVLAPDVAMPVWSPPRKWIFTATGARRAGARMRGFGFIGMARQAREGGGAISLRQTEAGLRLIADAERAASDARLTMDWDAGPTTKQRRGASGGGHVGAALEAAQRLRVLRKRVGEDAWRIAWSLCVDGDTISAIMRRFGLGAGFVKARLAEVLERLAAAYDG